MRWVITDGKHLGAIWAETEELARLVAGRFRMGSEEVFTQVDDHTSPLGRIYNGWDGLQYLCVAHDPRYGYWMLPLLGGEPRNVSERAIGRTYHEARRD